MKTIQVAVAGREYTITPLPIKKNREWRKQFDAPIQDAANLLAEVGSYADGEFEDMSKMIGEIGKAVSGKLPDVINHLLGSADTITKAVFDYSPELKKDKKHIEENGFDDEIVGCFISILGLAFPFGQAIQGLMKIGQPEQQTQASSVSESLESGTTISSQKTSKS
jgi:hypothetical protein